MSRSKHEAAFALWLKEVGCPEMEQEYRFDPKRRWRLDFAYVGTKTAVEIDGGEFIAGAHNRGAQMAYYYEKRNAALAQNWLVLQLTGKMVQRDGKRWALEAKRIIERDE